MDLAMHRFRQLVVVALVASATAWAQPARQHQRDRRDDEQVTEQATARLEAISHAFRTVAKKVKPTVVQITATVETKNEEKSTRKPSFDPKELPEPFRDLFKDFEQMPKEPTPQYGRGSGVIIDAEQGYILTNNHVVGGGEAKKEDVRIDIILDSGRRVEARIVGQDPKTDVALVKITESDLNHVKKQGEKLQAIEIGDSSKMEVGDWVLAIGAPFGLAETVTQGIISAKGRQAGIADIEDFIQTDAAINPGNSGGPLVNMRGELIGINTAIATSGLTRGYMGIGFAIPTAMVAQVLPDLKAGREVVRGYLGVAISDLKQQPGLARTFGLEQDRGVLIEEVRPDTPASKAGLKADDVVLAVGDEKIDSVKQLQGLVAQTKPGNTLDVVVWRDGKEMTIPVKIEAQPEDFYAARNWGRGGRAPGGRETSAETTIDSVGMTVAKATPELAKKYGWDYDDIQGYLIVTDVEPLGEAGALRISAGDVIVSVQGEQVKTGSALRKALSPEALEEGVRLRVRSEYGTRTLLLQVTQ